jgi:hypothetical protein
MAEDFVSAELVLPGTYIRVRSEGLIGVRGISAGNIGIVGPLTPIPPAAPAPTPPPPGSPAPPPPPPPPTAGVTRTLSSAAEAEAFFGPAFADASTKALNLTAMIGELYRNGARTVYAHAVSNATAPAGYTAAFNELLKEDVQILVAPSLPTTGTSGALGILKSIAEAAETAHKDVIGVVGADGATASAVGGQAADDDRIILAAPGYAVFNPADPPNDIVLPGNYSAGPVAALLSSLAPHVSPTNKVLPGVATLAQRFSYGERKDLVNKRILVLEDRSGIRVVRGITTNDGPFTQITTRRIVDFSKAGIRQVANPFIGRLNNVRVRAALQAAIDGFLTSMLVDEQLTAYQLEVTATRRDEIEGRAIVNVLLQPTFSIDFVAVTIVLQ